MTNNQLLLTTLKKLKTSIEAELYFPLGITMQAHYMRLSKQLNNKEFSALTDYLVEKKYDDMKWKWGDKIPRLEFLNNCIWHLENEKPTLKH